MVSQVKLNVPARKVERFKLNEVTDSVVSGLSEIGINIDRVSVSQMMEAAAASQTSIGMDANFTPSITTPSVATPVQFLQTWLPGFVHVMTAARRIDELIGMQMVGSWYDQEIVQGILEPSGTALEYGDYSNIPMQSWNTNFTRRTVYRGELGLQVGILEEQRAAAMRVSSSQEKRNGIGIALEQTRNAIGFNGYYNGNNQTYGFLNDPNLPAYQTVASNGASSSSTQWKDKSTIQIIADIQTAFAQLIAQSGGVIDPMRDKITLALPTSVAVYMTTTTDFGYSVNEWLGKNSPQCRVVSAPELVNANGGANVFYVYADEIDESLDGSTDGGNVFAQLVQSKFMTLGTEKRTKSYIEGYSNATAGTLCKRPWGVVRYTGI